MATPNQSPAPNLAGLTWADLNWLPDRMTLNGFTYRLAHTKSEDWDGGDHFQFYKIKLLVDQYVHFFTKLGDFSSRNIFELGTYDGGSTAFWYEMLRPEKLVAIDIKDGEDSEYFRNWVKLGKKGDFIRTYWRTDQSDKERLRKCFYDNFSAPLDLVIDDASHLYLPSKASFEALFPLCRPGAIYILEDWAWAHWVEGHYDPSWAFERRLTDLVIEFIEAVGTSNSLIDHLDVYQGFAAIVRGSGKIEEPFSLDKHILRHPTPSLLRKLRTRIAKILVPPCET
jgi:hypothetical protein